MSFNGHIHRHISVAVITLAVLGISPISALAATAACDGVKVDVTTAREEAYAPFVASAMDNEVKPDQVEFNTIMESGDWSAAYISTPVADDGVMFFQDVDGEKQFRDVWGGWADASERPELAAWAEELGAPNDLADCFAETVTEEE